MKRAPGQYVRTFAEASHVIPQGLPPEAGVFPVVVRIVGRRVTLRLGDAEKTADIRTRNGRESCTIEIVDHRPAAGPLLLPFDCHPFKHDDTPAFGAAQATLF
ncbi:MAG: hypothetical protein QM775_16605 [Pirellulales bacterium]